MDINDFEGLLMYYGRSELFHTMQKMALDGLAKYPSHFTFRLYNGIALVLGNRMQEGIRELNPLKSDPDLSVASVFALLYAHKQCSPVDEEAIDNLEQRLKESSSSTNVAIYFNAGMFLFLAKKNNEARAYIEKALKLNSEHDSSIILKTWIDMYQYNQKVSGNIAKLLEQMLDRGKNIDTNLALIHCYKLRGQFENAINSIVKLSIRYPQLNIPLVVKMETQLAALDWDRAYETALRIINLDPTNIAALRVKAYLLLVREGNIKGGISSLQQLLVATERVESGNSKILLKICQLFGRISSRNKEVLTLTLRFIDKIIQSNPTVESIVELGNQRMLLGNIKEASMCYRSATKIENNNFFALCGLTLCQLLENKNTEQLHQQLELLSDLIHGEEHPLLLLVKAKISTTSDEAIMLLNKAIERHMITLEGQLFGCEYFLKLDPEFLLQVTTEILRHSPLQINVKHGINIIQDTVHISLKHCITILDVILKFCPAHTQGLYMRAKVNFLCEELSKAHSLLQRLINEIDASYTDAYLLLAQIQMHRQQYAKALQYLEMALSVNFALRENPKYHLLLGIGQRQQQQYPAAQKSFLSAMYLLGNETVTHSDTSHPRKQLQNEFNDNFTISDKVTLYVELISTYKDIGDIQGVYESERLLQFAMEEFNNTTEEGRLVIAHAEFMLQNSNVNKAIELLSTIQPGQSYYIQVFKRLHYLRIIHK